MTQSERVGVRHLMSSTLLIYAEHFGLRERAFSLQPDPEYLYWSDAHAHAYAMLEYGLLTHAPITVVTGEIGAGKTTLVRHFLRNIPEDFVVGLISNAHGDRGQLLQWVLLALGQSSKNDASYVDLFNQFQNFLISTYAAGRRTVLIFDEAQNLPVETLEELRMFSNINADKDELLQIVLIGQPQLREKINRPELEQFSQRVGSDVHLPAMNAEGVDHYIRHRLAVAGAQREIFTAAARKSVYHYSRGIPRLINKICETALVYAYSDDLSEIDETLIEKVVSDWKGLGHKAFGARGGQKSKLAPQKANARISALSGGGLSPKEIQQYLSDHYDYDVALDQVKTVTSALQSDAKTWLRRPLLRHYSVVCFEEMWVKILKNGNVFVKPLYVVFAQDASGRGHVLSIVIGQVIGTKTYAAILGDLVSRGVEQIDTALVEGGDGYSQAIKRAFPDATCISSIHRLVQLALGRMRPENFEQILSEITRICSTEDEAEALAQLDKLEEKWAADHFAVTGYWRHVWNVIATMPRKDAVVPSVIRAANTLRGVYRRLRGVAMSRRPFSSDEAVLQKVYAVLRKSQEANLTSPIEAKPRWSF